MDRLKGKRALITGGTSGIGLETARQFIAEGARVALTGTNPASLEAARKEFGDAALVIPSDASSVPAQSQLADQLKQSFGTLDIVFINAGVAELRPFDKWDEAAFDRSFNINFKGPFFLLQALTPILANPSSIILNGSINAHIGMPNTTVYGATKAAIISLARTISGELVSRGVRVNVVSAGPIATPLYGKLGIPADQLKGVADSIQQQVPMKRFGTPTEFARTVLYFASDDSAFTVGSELIIDGGMSNL
jgi:NAD(P)-dependent dehydrogenase (short-subunit alcohol dehydrogenase family)